MVQYSYRWHPRFAGHSVLARVSLSGTWRRDGHFTPHVNNKEHAEPNAHVPGLSAGVNLAQSCLNTLSPQPGSRLTWSPFGPISPLSPCGTRKAARGQIKTKGQIVGLYTRHRQTYISRQAGQTHSRSYGSRDSRHSLYKRNAERLRQKNSSTNKPQPEFWGVNTHWGSWWTLGSGNRQLCPFHIHHLGESIEERGMCRERRSNVTL